MEEDSLAMTSTELQRQSDLEELKPNDNDKASVDMIHALSTGSIYGTFQKKCEAKYPKIQINYNTNFFHP